MNRKWWKLIFVLPIFLCILYAGGYIAQFICNYQIWTRAGNFAGNGSYPKAPSLHFVHFPEPASDAEPLSL